MEDSILEFLAEKSRALLGFVLPTFWSTYECHHKITGTGRRGHASVPNPLRQTRAYDDILLDMDVVQEHTGVPSRRKGCEAIASCKVVQWLLWYIWNVL